MRSPSPIKELEEIITKDAHPYTNNISGETKSSLTSKSTDLKLQYTIRPNNYPAAKTSFPVEPTNSKIIQILNSQQRFILIHLEVAQRNRMEMLGMSLY